MYLYKILIDKPVMHKEHVYRGYGVLDGSDPDWSACFSQVLLEKKVLQSGSTWVLKGVSSVTPLRSLLEYGIIHLIFTRQMI